MIDDSYIDFMGFRNYVVSEKVESVLEQFAGEEIDFDLVDWDDLSDEEIGRVIQEVNSRRSEW